MNSQSKYEVHVTRIETIVTQGVVTVRAKSHEEAEMKAKKRAKWDQKRTKRQTHHEDFISMLSLE